MDNEFRHPQGQAQDDWWKVSKMVEIEWKGVIYIVHEIDDIR